MKKSVLLAFMLMAFITGKVLAQQQERMGSKTAEQRTEIMTKNLVEKLSLTPEQKTQLEPIILRREKLREAGKLSATNRDQISADISKLLTPAQQAAWKEMRKEQRNKAQKPRRSQE